MKASNPQRVRKDNLFFLMSLIREYGPLSKRELSEKSGLSVVTINKLIPELLSKELIEPYSTDVVTGGRYAISYTFNQNKCHSLIIKMVEKEKEMFFYFYVCDLLGEIIEEKEISGENLEWLDILSFIESFKKEYPKIKAMVLGIPGVEKSGVITLADYPVLQGKNIKDELEERFDCIVLVENDVNAAILGFSKKEEAHLIIAGIYYPVGFPPGGGVSIGQKLLKGRNNFVGEVAMLPLNVDWSEKNIPHVDLKNHFLDIAKTFISLYDPHQIVVYLSKSRLTKQQLTDIKQALEVAFPLLKLPEIVISEKFNHYYFLGLESLGLEALNQVLKNEIEIGE